MAMVTIRQLQYLVALADTLHFGRAAVRCAVTQPALSTQIRALESELGVRLFERRPSGVVPTEQGREVVRRASDVLASVRDLIDYARHDERLLAGELRLGAIPSIAPYLLPRALPRITEAYPHLDLSIRETLTATLIEELAEGYLDAIVVALPIEAADLECMVLFDDRFVLAVPANGDGVPSDRPVPLSQLSGMRILLLEEGHCLRQQALSVCAMAEPADLRGFGASSLTTLTQLVANGFGVTLLPEMALRTELRGDVQVRVRHFEPPEPVRQIGLAWRRSSPRGRDFKALGALLSQCHAAEVDRPQGDVVNDRVL